MNTYYFRRDKTAVLGAIKVKLPFSGEANGPSKKVGSRKILADFHMSRSLLLFSGCLCLGVSIF